MRKLMMGRQRRGQFFVCLVFKGYVGSTGYRSRGLSCNWVPCNKLDESIGIL